MSWQNYTTAKVYTRLGPFKFALLAIVVFVAGGLAGKQLANREIQSQQQQITDLQQNQEQLYLDYNQLEQRFNILNVELQVEKQTSVKAQRYLQEAQDEEYSLRRQLNFYQKMMAPELAANGVVIESIELTPTTSLNHYRYKLTLVQTNPRKTPSQGNVDITIQGSQDQKPREISLNNIAVNSIDTNFKFKYFDVIEGEFGLPEGFVPEQMLVAVNLPKTRWQKAALIEHNYPWSESALMGQQSLSN